MDKNENAEERVTEGDSVRKDVTNLTQGEGRVHSSILVRDYETLIEAIDRLAGLLGILSNTVGHDGEYLKPRENHELMRARDLLIGLRRTLQEREQDAHARSKEGRIDLTQFDGIMEGPWELRTRPHGRNGMERRPEPNYNSTDVQKRLQAFTLTTTFSQEKSMCGYPHHSSIHFPASFDDADWLRVSLATARAIASAPDLVAELEKQYKREDELLEALRIIRDDLNDALKVYPILNKEDVEKVRNFANDASQ